MKYLLSLCLMLMLLAMPAEAQSNKKKGNKDDDKIPATITAEYKQKTLDLMKEFSYYDGYDMIISTLAGRYNLYRSGMPDNFVDSLFRTPAQRDEYLNALVELYSKEFSLNEVRKLHEYFTSDLFRKANMGATAFQGKIDELMSKMFTKKEEELKAKMKEAGYEMPKIINVNITDEEPEE